MNKFLLAWIVVFICWFAGSYVVHGLLLHDDYAKLTNLFRAPADAQPLFPLMIVAHLMLSRAGASLRRRRRAADDCSDLPHLLRRAADAGRRGGEADRLRRHPDPAPRLDHRVHLQAADSGIGDSAQPW